MFHLGIGENICLTVFAHQPRSGCVKPGDSGAPDQDETDACQKLSVEVGEVYGITVPKNQTWIDWFVPASPNGFFYPVGRKKRRMPEFKFFYLCGGVETSTHQEVDLFGVGVTEWKEIRIQQAGTLFFFANDWPEKYHNNKGKISIQIKRIA